MNSPANGPALSGPRTQLDLLGDAVVDAPTAPLPAVDPDHPANPIVFSGRTAPARSRDCSWRTPWGVVGKEAFQPVAKASLQPCNALILN